MERALRAFSPWPNARGSEFFLPLAKRIRGRSRGGLPPTPSRKKSAAKPSQSFDSFEKGDNVETSGTRAPRVFGWHFEQ